MSALKRNPCTRMHVGAIDLWIIFCSTGSAGESSFLLSVVTKYVHYLSGNFIRTFFICISESFLAKWQSHPKWLMTKIPQTLQLSRVSKFSNSYFFGIDFSNLIPCWWRFKFSSLVYFILSQCLKIFKLVRFNLPPICNDLGVNDESAG